MLNRLLSSAGASLRGFTPYGPGGSYGGGYGFAPWVSGSSYDYGRESGRKYDNSIVLTCLNFLRRKQSEVLVQLEQEDAQGKFTVAGKHAIVSTLRRPNVDYGDSVLWAGILLSWFVHGNAYLYKVPSNAGGVAGYYYIPHFQIQPRADKYNPGGQRLITYYLYTPIGGTPVELSLDEVVHLRYGIDPAAPMLGLSPIGASLREICADNEAATYCAAMLRNMGVPSVILSPKPTKDMQFVNPTPDQRRDMKEKWNEFRRDARGGVIAMPMPLDVTFPAFDPEKMILGTVRNDAAARICAAIGFDPMAVGLPSDSKTYSNFNEALTAALENCLLPTLRDIVGQIFDAVADDFKLDRERFRLGLNVGDVRGLQEDTDALHERYREDYAAGGIDRATFKERIGEIPEPGDKGVYATDFRSAANAPQDGKKSYRDMLGRARARRREVESAT